MTDLFRRKPREMSTMPDDPNTITPERHEAERDEHDTQQARGRCRPSDPCPACRRAMAERRQTRAR